MAEEKTKILEREYTIPLRKAFLKVPQYRRAGKAARAIKIFIAKHMKVPERDVDKVKMDMYLNNEVWFRGKTNPPTKIKVKATKEGDIVRVELVDTPEHIKFLKTKHSKVHKAAEKTEEKSEAKTEVKPGEVKEEKIEEREKEKSVEKEQMKEAKKEKLAEKHVTKVKQAEIKRTALNRH